MINADGYTDYLPLLSTVMLSLYVLSSLWLSYDVAVVINYDSYAPFSVSRRPAENMEVPSRCPISGDISAWIMTTSGLFHHEGEVYAGQSLFVHRSLTITAITALCSWHCSYSWQAWCRDLFFKETSRYRDSLPSFSCSIMPSCRLINVYSIVFWILEQHL